MVLFASFSGSASTLNRALNLLAKIMVAGISDRRFAPLCVSNSFKA